LFFFTFRIFEQLALALKKGSCPEIFTVLNIFLHSGFLKTCACTENRVSPENFHCIKCFFTFRIFEQLALALKHRVCPEFTVLNMYFLLFRSFEQIALPLKNSFHGIFPVLKYFYHSGFLRNSRLPWKIVCAQN